MEPSEWILSSFEDGECNIESEDRVNATKSGTSNESSEFDLRFVNSSHGSYRCNIPI